MNDRYKNEVRRAMPRAERSGVLWTTAPRAPAPKTPTPTLLSPVAILMAVVAGSTPSSRRRLVSNVRSVSKELIGQPAVVRWAVCAYDDMAHEWADVQRQLADQMVLLVNTSTTQRGLRAAQRRAKLYHRARIVEEAKALVLDGVRRPYDAFWFLDEDISFARFEMVAFLQRWACAFGAAGPPVIAQPMLHKGRESGQGWPQSDDTYQLCLSGELGARWGDDACFLRDALAVRNDWVEQWATLIDARFMVWWLRQETTQKIVQQQLLLNTDFGSDEIWCGAAAEWVAGPARHTHNVGARMPHTVGARVPCAVVTVPILDDETRRRTHTVTLVLPLTLHATLTFTLTLALTVGADPP